MSAERHWFERWMAAASRLALWSIERSLSPSERDAVVGDVIEEYEALSAVDVDAARRWLLWQAVRSVVPNLGRRLADRGFRHEKGAARMNGFSTDLKFALRLMRRQPMMTLVAFLSLTAGFGLNLVLFTLANAILLRPLPLREAGELMVVLSQREAGLNHDFSYPTYLELRDRSQTLQGLVAYSETQATARGADGSELLEGEAVSGNFFGVLGVPLRTGRGLMPDDDRRAAGAAVVISERLWRNRFGAAPLSGQTITLNGEPFTLVGVASSEFRGMQLGRSVSFWAPLAKSTPLVGGDFLGRPTMSWLTMLGRPADAGRPEVVRQELDALLARVFESQRRPIEPVVLRPGGRGDSLLPEQIGSPLMLLVTAGLLVLLVSCVNVANLQLARSEARRLELAVRAALGARRGQLLRLMALDGLLIASTATLAGLGLAAAFTEDAASLIALYGRPVALATPIDWRVLASSALLAMTAGILIATLSTWQLVRRQPAGELSDGRSMTSRRRALHRGLVVAQFAVSMGLLTGAALLVRTLDQLRSRDLGYESRRIALVGVSPEMARMPPSAAVRYFDDVIRAVGALPGVERVSVGHVMPLDFGGSRTSVDVAGYTPAAGEDMELNFLRVTAGYFETLRIPLRQGRYFDERDRPEQPMKVIVNETMARRFWPDGRAVGRFMRTSTRDPFDIEIVGVVPDVHYRMVREEPTASFYVPLTQMPTDNGVIHVRFDADPAGRLDEIRRAVASVNTSVPVTRVSTLRQQVERNIADERMAGAIGVVLAAVALVLAASSLYATMAFVVGRRTREIGVRVALGARGADVRGMVLREGLRLVATGMLAGVGLAIWVAYALRSQLYGIKGLDGPSLIGAAAVLTAAALAASWVPAWRAARIDPVVALRAR